MLSHTEALFLAARQVLYALTAGVAGYVSAVSYKIMGGANWVRNVLLTTALFCGLLLAMFSFLNTVAIVYRTTTALPFGTIVIILVIWALITFPLTVLGGIAGKNSKARASPPSCTCLCLVPSTRALVCSACHPHGVQINKTRLPVARDERCTPADTRRNKRFRVASNGPAPEHNAFKP